MIGVLLLSHGELAQGMLNTLKLFFGDDIEAIRAECLKAEDSVDEFDQRIKTAIRELDDGHGVIVMCELFGGTPSNRCAFIQSDRIRVFSGVNLGFAMEMLNTRSYDIEDVSQLTDEIIDSILEAGRNGLLYLNREFANASFSDDDDDDDD